MNKLILWTDGSASPNPGPGGYAVIQASASANQLIESSVQKGDSSSDGYPVALGREAQTTNIQMEGYALRAALQYANGTPCEIHTDSEFWLNTLTKWAPKWASNGWQKKGGPIKNLELVQELYRLYCESSAELIWTRGHVGTPENELADEWANKARKGAELPQPSNRAAQD